MSSRRSLLVGAKSSLERRSDVANFTTIYVWLFILSLALGLSLGLYATQKVNPALSMLEKKTTMTEMILESFISNITEANTVSTGTYDVYGDADLFGSSTYNVKEIAVGDLTLSFLELDAFSIEVTMPQTSFVLRFFNFNPVLQQQVGGIENELLFSSPSAVNKIILPQGIPNGCFNVIDGFQISNGVFPFEIIGSTCIQSSPPFTIGLSAPVRILFQVV